MRHALPLLATVPMFLFAAACDQDFNVITGAPSSTTADGGGNVAADGNAPLQSDGSVITAPADSGSAPSEPCAAPLVETQLAARPYPVECDGLDCWMSYNPSGSAELLFAEPDDVVPPGYRLNALGATSSRAYFEAYPSSGTTGSRLILSAALHSAARDQRLELTVPLRTSLQVNGNSKRIFFLVGDPGSNISRLYRSGDNGAAIAPLGAELAGTEVAYSRLFLLPSGRLDGEDDVYVANEASGMASFYGVDHLRGTRTDYAYPDTGLENFSLSGVNSNQAVLTAFKLGAGNDRPMVVHRLGSLVGGAGTLLLQGTLARGADIYAPAGVQHANASYSVQVSTGTMLNTGKQLQLFQPTTGTMSVLFQSGEAGVGPYSALSDAWSDVTDTTNSPRVYTLEACPGSNLGNWRYELRSIDLSSGAATWVPRMPGAGDHFGKLKAWYSRNQGNNAMPTPDGAVIVRRSLQP